MIKKIDIENFGIFKNFKWENYIKDNLYLDKINIFYGRNYSGKTTLSKIIHTLETKDLSDKYSNPSFSIYWKDDKSTTTQNNFSQCTRIVRVFNKDFVDKNFSFFHNEDEKIPPFAMIGEDNIKIETQIGLIKFELGNNEDGEETKLYADLKQKLINLSESQENYNVAKSDFENTKKHKAINNPNGIKYKSNLFGDQNYNIGKLENDIKTVDKTDFIDINDTERQKLEEVIKEVEKAEIDPLLLPKKDFQYFYSLVKNITEKPINKSEEIKELATDYILSEWVKQGMKHHSEKHKTCIFCGSSITDERWQQLNKHFDKSKQDLETEIEKAEKEIKVHNEEIERIASSIKKDAFYIKFHEQINEIDLKVQKFIDNYKKQTSKLLDNLTKRKQSIAIPFTIEKIEDLTHILNEIVATFEQLRTESNAYTDNLASNKKISQDKLRLHEVRKFLDDIDYKKIIQNIDNFNSEKEEIESEVQKLRGTIIEKEKEILSLKMKLDDKEVGAKKVTEFLNLLTPQHLSLEPQAEEIENENKQIYFKVMRHGEEAYNLSEGECSLIAFCYFLAKLEDTTTNGCNPLIWIDDPICSLDSNHIFFVYSLLRAKIVDEGKFSQLFISTHSLDFLKYLKRLPSNFNGGEVRWLMIERSENNSRIIQMPKYLKEYITEFNYLFHQIYNCANSESLHDENYTEFYNFGNNARKFLELYLYYSYPDGVPEKEDKGTRLRNVFGNKVEAYLIDRVNNEQSHLAGGFERGGIPVAIPEIKEVAELILKGIEKKDSEQYKAFLKSIGITHE